MSTELTQEKLKELLHYDPETGIFTWRVSPAKNVKPGDTAGSLSSTGYLYIGISGRSYRAHRLAWLCMEGFSPKNINIDHIDRNPANNKWYNLRLASQQCNLRNTGNRKDNTSGVKGIYWDRRRQKWKAQIVVAGKTKSLGRYKDFGDAVRARLAAEKELNWGSCNVLSPAAKYLYLKGEV